MAQSDLFGSTTESADPVVGVTGRLPTRPCRSCGSIDVTIESTGRAMHHGSREVRLWAVSWLAIEINVRI